MVASSRVQPITQMDGLLTASVCHSTGCTTCRKGTVHQSITTIGLDTAKSVFQTQAVDDAG